MGQQAKQVLVIGDVPRIPFPPLVMSSVLQRGQDDGNFAFMSELSEAPQGREDLEAMLARHALDPKHEGRLKFHSVAPLFINAVTGRLMLIDPCQYTLVYKDSDHINEDGAVRGEPFFRTEVFGQV